MMLRLVTAWARIKAQVLTAAAFIIGTLVVVAAIYGRGKSAGSAEAKQKQREVDDAARKRMEDVAPADSAATVDKLRSGRF